MGIHYQQLTLHERYQIEIYNDMGLSARSIALHINRGNRTVSQELKRCHNQPYRAIVAHNLARQAKACSGRVSHFTETLTKTIFHYLSLGFSPQQIADRFRLEKQAIHFSCSALYQLIHREGWEHLLARKGKKYKTRSIDAGLHLIPERVDIDERPAHVDKKRELGG